MTTNRTTAANRYDASATLNGVTPDTAEGAQAVMAEIADPRVLRTMAASGGSWVSDPEFDRVWGFITEGQVIRVVVYLDALDGEGDFTCDEEWVG